MPEVVLQGLQSGEVDAAGLLELIAPELAARTASSSDERQSPRVADEDSNRRFFPDRASVPDPPACRGAIFGYPAPGKIGIVYPASIDADLGANAMAGLYQRLDEFLAARGCKILQAMVDVADPDADTVLRSMNYACLGQIAFLVADNLRDLPCPMPAAVRLVAIADAGHLDLPDLVLRTYQGSLDCPEIDGVRAIEDVLDGYRATGVTADRHWQLLLCDDRPAGCLLLGEHKLHQWELIYMGVEPKSRGCGLGELMVDFAKTYAARHGALAMSLAVDTRNTPALRVYRQRGFREWIRRQVYFKVLNR